MGKQFQVKKILYQTLHCSILIHVNIHASIFVLCFHIKLEYNFHIKFISYLNFHVIFVLIGYFLLGSKIVERENGRQFQDILLKRGIHNKSSAMPRNTSIAKVTQGKRGKEKAYMTQPYRTIIWLLNFTLTLTLNLIGYFTIPSFRKYFSHVLLLKLCMVGALFFFHWVFSHWIFSMEVLTRHDLHKPSI